MKKFSFEYTVQLFKTAEKLSKHETIEPEALKALDELQWHYTLTERRKLIKAAPRIFKQIFEQTKYIF